MQILLTEAEYAALTDGPEKKAKAYMADYRKRLVQALMLAPRHELGNGMVISLQSISRALDSIPDFVAEPPPANVVPLPKA